MAKLLFVRKTSEKNPSYLFRPIAIAESNGHLESRENRSLRQVFRTESVRFLASEPVRRLSLPVSSGRISSSIPDSELHGKRTKISISVRFQVGAQRVVRESIGGDLGFSQIISVAFSA